MINKTFLLVDKGFSKALSTPVKVVRPSKQTMLLSQTLSLGVGVGLLAAGAIKKSKGLLVLGGVSVLACALLLHEIDKYEQ